MEVNRDIRMTETFTEFLKALEPKVRKKYLYVIQVLKTESVVSEKFIKHLENTNLYEMRVSLSSNEYRTIVFSIDAVNIISATKVLLLNSFLKKDTKQYRSEINKAVKLLEEWRTEYEED
ncbi:type II toxin-antitoxin system RelE/ParE family toxin [Prevotella melaninogenica]|jgi:putative toxin-antitoxin system, toxin component, relE family|uniref:type II toxin-antitoxin system RelE/ParE family toxin n=1 Tax=Prevotella melaninogenica TaxID=28132 RepID=UPI0005C69E61|nr:type II toxin-antitoxin system RelE/ParE family toxin [Prevotella melaninogenica]ASE17699.1 addiction module toxin RelE [Prevotella melaninogenica]MBF1577705.1 type II toxin-antitoxin system RelE/ParE family toxin [Prevotella sp.]MBF1635439.1 type II toxin-antitoxin system RelE/ParE family toxin [Prevotella sp.]UEB08004.1 type II toxin-antitoxin system RelE/ParE family toxin [Prevotella melaninogenica]